MTHHLVLTSISDFFPSSEVATTRQTDSAVHKLKPRSFHKSAYFQVHSSVNYTWQYYQTPKSAVTSEQFHLLNPLLQFHLQSIPLYTSKSKWLPLTIILQLQSYRLEHPSIQSRVSVTRWLICQICYDAQDKSINEAIYLWGPLLVQSNLAG